MSEGGLWSRRGHSWIVCQPRLTRPDIELDPLGSGVGFASYAHSEELGRSRLQHDTAATALTLLKGQEGGASGSLKDIIDALAAQARTFQIPLGVNLAADSLAVVLGNESQRLLAHLLDRDRVFSEVLLQTDEDNRDTAA